MLSKWVKKVGNVFSIPYSRRKNTVIIATTILLAIAVAVPSYLIAQNIREKKADISVVQALLDQIQTNFVDEVDPEVLIQGALEGMISSLEDPHTALLSDGELMRLKGMVVGSFGGLGMYVDKQKGDTLPQYVEVISPIAGTPADQKGLRSADLILSIDGEGTSDMTLEEAITLLRGDVGTKVTLEIKRARAEPFPVVLTRAVIQVPTADYGLINNDIGYIRLFVFTSLTGEKLREAVQNLLDRGAKYFIIDLRDNGGGSLDGAVRAADVFFNNKLVVSIQGREETSSIKYTTQSQKILSDDVPIIVLINGASASASEILAGVLKDYERATLLGVTTYGKGSVQRIIEIDDYVIRLTTARYYTPSGVDIDKIGIDPDIIFEEQILTDEEVEAYTEFMNQERLQEFIEDNNFSAAAIEEFVESATKDIPELNEAHLRYRIRNEVYRVTENKIRLYDLEYDLMLKEAINQF